MTPATDARGEAMVDVAFQLPAGRLAVDHAWALASAVSLALPWFAAEPDARLHQVHTAATGSGWIRPDAAGGEELHLSRRTRLKLRVPERRAADALALSGRALQVDSYTLTPGAGRVLPLTPADTLLARHLLCDDGEDEARMVGRLQQALDACGIGAGPLIVGRAQRITTPDAVLHTRSVVVTQLDPDGAKALLARGIGPRGELGCGIFVPYKRID